MEVVTRPIESQYFLEARKEAIERYPGTSAVEAEVECMLTQARLALDLQRRNERRIFIAIWPEKYNALSENKDLQMDEEANIITLTGLRIFPDVGEQGGETTVGTLEVHANGFFYKTSNPDFHFQFLYRGVNKAFFQVEDEKRLPLLHFHLYDPIKVGAEMRQNIQLHLVQTPMGQRNDSGKFEDEKQGLVVKI
ncbi:FACT complex subunit SPT16-like [Papaver somniferum]|uniref:FACT complex subunit SPT16-like n=1 Tax=Papaver somniferum TaxID=3469 RepID=UPI000E6F9398|nr:FACT complex subunit SPT16-like [Papaver somniferum]